MRKKELYRQVIAYFEQAMPVAETELHYDDPYPQCAMHRQARQSDYPALVP